MARCKLVENDSGSEAGTFTKEKRGCPPKEFLLMQLLGSEGLQQINVHVNYKQVV